MFSTADIHDDKNNVGKKEFIWLTCSDQRLSLREVWAGTQAGAEAENREIWLLSCSVDLYYFRPIGWGQVTQSGLGFPT